MRVSTPKMAGTAIGIAALGALALTGCSSSSSSSSPSASAGGVTVNLTAQNNSGVNGTATLTAQGTETLVTLTLTGQPDGSFEPAHIHTGTCANLDPTPQYFLTDSGTSSTGGQLWVQNGKATALVNVPLATLQASPHAINVHQSPTDLPAYVSCGDIPSS